MKEKKNIFISRVINSHMGPMYIETPYRKECPVLSLTSKKLAMIYIFAFYTLLLPFYLSIYC